MFEIMGAGAGLFDADADGDLDLFLPQGNTEPPDPSIVDRLFVNDGLNAEGVPRFRDATERAGVGSAGYSTGVAAADFDGDGHVDLYVSAFGPDLLWRNRGDGTFEDVTEAAGLVDDGWTVGGAWVDVDRDGDLDLHVVRYLDMPPEAPTVCPSPSGEPDYCGPTTYEPQVDRLWRNRGDGTFEDATLALGLAGRRGSGLGVVTLDIEGDGWLDLFVANDKMANFLWSNRAGERFEERAVELGAAVNAVGVAEAGMGVDAADVDADGDEDVAIAHLAGETHTLYRNEGGWFADDGQRAGLEASSRAATGFGLAWLDLDNDGRLDLASVHGHVHRIPELSEAGDPFPYHQPDGLWLGRDGGLEPQPSEVSELLRRSSTSRGLAVGDVDDDGDPDLVVTGVDAPVGLWLNQVGQDAAWLGLRLVTQGRDALGALAVLDPDGPRRGLRRVRTDGSYGSSRDPRLLFGLGDDESESTVEISWPSGRRERFEQLASRRYHLLREGSGLAVEASP